MKTLISGKQLFVIFFAFRFSSTQVDINDKFLFVKLLCSVRCVGYYIAVMYKIEI